MDKQALREWVESQGIEYSAVFVPQAQSRNAGEKVYSLNWRVTISKGNASITTDYMQGIGHLPHYSHQFAKILCYDDALREACNTGKSRIIAAKSVWDAAHGPSRKIPAPDLLNVLHSLVLDAEVLNYVSFEEWAQDFGYDPDSRKAEGIYRQCMDIALHLRQILDIEKAAELFSDY